MKLLTHSQLAKVTRNGERSQHDPNFDPHPGREALHPRCAVHLATLGNRPARPRSRLRPLRSRARLPRGRLRQLEGARCRARQVGPSHRARPLVQTEGPALRLRRHRAPLGAHRDVGSSRNRGSNPRSRAGSGPAAVGTQRVAPLKSRWVHCCARRPRRRCRSVGRATLTASKMVPFPALPTPHSRACPQPSQLHSQSDEGRHCFAATSTHPRLTVCTLRRWLFCKVDISSACGRTCHPRMRASSVRSPESPPPASRRVMFDSFSRAPGLT